MFTVDIISTAKTPHGRIEELAAVGDELPEELLRMVSGGEANFLSEDGGDCTGNPESC
jgi:hypothetical protein